MPEPAVGMGPGSGWVRTAPSTALALLLCTFSWALQVVETSGCEAQGRASDAEDCT